MGPYATDISPWSSEANKWKAGDRPASRVLTSPLGFLAAVRPPICRHAHRLAPQKIPFNSAGNEHEMRGVPASVLSLRMTAVTRSALSLRIDKRQVAQPIISVAAVSWRGVRTGSTRELRVELAAQLLLEFRDRLIPIARVRRRTCDQVPEAAG